MDSRRTLRVASPACRSAPHTVQKIVVELELFILFTLDSSDVVVDFLSQLLHACRYRYVEWCSSSCTCLPRAFGSIDCLCSMSAPSRDITALSVVALELYNAFPSLNEQCAWKHRCFFDG